MAEIFYQILIYQGTAVIAVPLATRLGFGSVLGYLDASITIGPLFGVGGSKTKDLQNVTEFGSVIMLFLIGLSLNPRALWDIRHRLLGRRGLQLGLTTGCVMLGAIALDIRPPPDWSMNLFSRCPGPPLCCRPRLNAA